MKVEIQEPVAARILSWYAHSHRDLPWRRTRDPYRIWVSEVMLQQTRVETVIPYYHRFLSRFPDFRSLADAPLEEVLKAWENLGYYARARHLHEAAREIVARWGGQVPRTWDEIRSLPGVGEYMAGAIMSIAFGHPVPAMDGNARRVLARLFAVRDELDGSAARRHLRGLAEGLVPENDPARFNQALMDLGNLICTPRKPACDGCPLRSLCRANELGLEAVLPVRRKRKPLPYVHWTAGVIFDGRGRLLVALRLPEGLLGGLWKFPGGKQEPEEGLEASLVRAVREELDIGIRVHEPIVAVEHAFTHFRVTLHAFQGTRLSGKPRPRGCAACRWATLEEVDGLALAKVDREVLRSLRLTRTCG